MNKITKEKDIPPIIKKYVNDQISEAFRDYEKISAKEMKSTLKNHFLSK